MCCLLHSDTHTQAKWIRMGNLVLPHFYGDEMSVCACVWTSMGNGSTVGELGFTSKWFGTGLFEWRNGLFWLVG